MTQLLGRRPILIAHRGYSGRYPENTLLSYQAAYTHGAKYMELDLQLTSDCVPVLHHDTSLQRMAGVDLDIWDVNAKQLKNYQASYSERFGDEFDDNSFTTFDEFCQWLKQNPDVTIFVEIKNDSAKKFGLQVFMDEVYKTIVESNVENQCVIISFNDKVVEYSRKISPMRVGWVLPKWKKSNKKILKKLKPDFMFCDKNFLPLNDEKIWAGSWQWAIYNLDDVDSAIAMANRGMTFLETNQIGRLMADKRLSDRV
ncbi:MAG: hypothetical protein KTR16_12055 [Acidiferrobacterales bacterium]|nr:hypothetical protein [Acidiferrobacterales bacterium]